MDVSEPRSECVVSVPFARDGLEIVDVYCNLALFDIEMNTITFVEMVD